MNMDYASRIKSFRQALIIQEETWKNLDTMDRTVSY